MNRAVTHQAPTKELSMFKTSHNCNRPFITATRSKRPVLVMVNLPRATKASNALSVIWAI